MLKVLTSTKDIPLLITSNSVRNKIEDEFMRARNIVKKEVLARAISRIHVSCDLWLSPNGYVMCSVVAYFIGHQGTVQAVLLALKRIRAAHRGEEITEVIIDTIKQYEFKDNLGVFITDNTELNNVTWRVTLTRLYPQRDPVTSRSRCLGHIINLAVKAFLLGKDTEVFKVIINQVNDSTPRDLEVIRNTQTAWRKKGPVRKLHNIIVFIRSLP
jgi:hypothetical protein